MSTGLSTGHAQPFHTPTNDDMAPGTLILLHLEATGWNPGLVGRRDGGVRVVCQHPLYGRVAAEGASVADVASDLFERCANARQSYLDDEASHGSTEAVG